MANGNNASNINIACKALINHLLIRLLDCFEKAFRKEPKIFPKNNMEPTSPISYSLRCSLCFKKCI